MLHHVPRQSQQDPSLPLSSPDLSGSSPTSAPPSSTPESSSPSSVPPSSLPESSILPGSSTLFPSSLTPDSSSIIPISLPPSSSSRLSTPIPPPSITDITPALTPPPSQSSFLTPSPTVTFNTASFTTFVTTLSDGSVSTVTSLASPSQPRGTSSRIGLIAGTTTAGIVALLCILGVVFAYRRNKLRRFLDELTSKRKEHKGLLDDEDFDDDDHLRGPGAMRVLWDADRDGRVGTPTSYTGTFTRASQPSPSPAPSLFRTCASESGSIFREEGVWPPPGKESQFVDPFLGHVKRMSNEVDLTRIVDDVMGSGMPAARMPPPAHHSSPSGSSSSGLSIGIPSPSGSSGTNDRFHISSAMSASSNLTTAPPQFTLSPLSGAPPSPSSFPAATRTSPDRKPSHSDTLRTASSTSTHMHANTRASSTSASMYSDSGTARTDEVGLISLGSTPIPSPTTGVSPPPPLLPPPLAAVPRQQPMQHYELPPGAARSVTPGLSMSQLQLQNDYDGPLHHPSPFLLTTAASTSGAREGMPLLNPIIPTSGNTLSESINNLMTGKSDNGGGMGVLAARAPLLSLSSSQAPPGVMTETLARQQQDGLGSGNASASGNVKLPLSQPKKSSPLARASSADAKIFLGK